MKTQLIIIVLAVYGAWTGCKRGAGNDPFADYPQVTISHPAGTQWSGSTGYLGLPFNVGHLSDGTQPCLVIGKVLESGQPYGVDVIGAIKIEQDSMQQIIILAQPADIELRTMMIKDFEHFATVHGAAKWQIEQYLTHYQGLGSVRVSGWEDRPYVQRHLLNNN